MIEKLLNKTFNRVINDIQYTNFKKLEKDYKSKKITKQQFKNSIRHTKFEDKYTHLFKDEIKENTIKKTINKNLKKFKKQCLELITKVG